MTIGHAFGGISVGSMALNARITVVSNAVAIAVVAALIIAVRITPTRKHESV